VAEAMVIDIFYKLDYLYICYCVLLYRLTSLFRVLVGGAVPKTTNAASEIFTTVEDGI
jgi:hypothetical protein